VDHQSIGPAHVQLLLHPEAPAGNALRIALLHLSTMGYIGVESVQKRILFVTTTSVRFGRRDGREPLPGELLVLLDVLFPPGKPPKPLASTEIIHRLQRQFGTDYGKYVAEHLRPELIERGWMREEEIRVLGVIPRRRHILTPEGEQVKVGLEERLRTATGVPRLLETDPRQALSAVAALGPLALLSDSLRSHLPALAEAARTEQGTITPLVDPGADLEEDERRLAWLDTLEMLSSMDWASVLDAMDSFGGDGGDGGDGGE
jgi:hypothetical protein